MPLVDSYPSPKAQTMARMNQNLSWWKHTPVYFQTISHCEKTISCELRKEIRKVKQNKTLFLKFEKFFVIFVSIMLTVNKYDILNDQWRTKMKNLSITLVWMHHFVGRLFSSTKSFIEQVKFFVRTSLQLFDLLIL